MIKVNDINSEELGIYSRFSEVQLKRINEPAVGVFVAESPKVIMRAMDAGYEPLSLLIDEEDRNEENLELISKMENAGVTVYTAPHDELSKLTGFNMTRGAMSLMRRKNLPSLSELLGTAKRVAVMEDVVNPTNVGAIFRSAAALGMDAVILTDKSSDPLYRRAARVSMGTVFQIPWTVVDCAEENISRKMKALGFKTVAFALRNDSVDITNEVLKTEEKLAVILGTEGDGLQTGTIDDCDYVVKIPMTNGVDSLNVAAASAVAFWELGGKKSERI